MENFNLVPTKCHKVLEVTHKTNIPIRHNGFGKTIEFDNLIKVKLGNLTCIRGFE